MLPTQLEIFIKISKTGKGIRTIFLHHEIQRHLLNQIIYLEYEKYLQEKNSFPEVSLFMCFEHPVEYPSTFVRESQTFISHCVSRVETLDEKMRRKNPLNFVISPIKMKQTSLNPRVQYVSAEL